MFLLGLGSRKAQEKKDEAPKTGGSLIRSCSRCGCFFEVVYGSEEGLDSSETVQGLHEMFLDYLSLERRNPDHFEDFILQFMDVSIEEDSRTLSSSTSVEESLCVDCMNCLISQFSMALNNEIGILDKYMDIKDIMLSPSDPLKGRASPDSGSAVGSEESPGKSSGQEVLAVIQAYNEFLEVTQPGHRQRPDREVVDTGEKEGRELCVINTIEVDDIVELKQGQSLELGLKQELVHCETKRDGTKNHLIYLKGYLERLKRTDFLNLSFNIQVEDGVSSINGLRPALFEADFENWSEVNAALGASALLLYTILERHKLPLSIYPSGSYSAIGDSSSSVWPLHGSVLCNSDYNECSLFDKGVSTLVFLIDSTFRAIPGAEETLPYSVCQKNNTIGGVCLNLLFNERESWNRAMGMNLINLKWLLVRSRESTTHTEST